MNARCRLPQRCTARGFSMLMVLWILVALAALGIALRQLAVTQHLETAQSLAVRQAQLAARSALDWGRHQLVTAGQACTAVPASLTVDGVAVGLKCVASGFTEGAQGFSAFTLTATATVDPGSLTEAKRQLRIYLVREDSP